MELLRIVTWVVWVVALAWFFAFMAYALGQLGVWRTLNRWFG
jgi:hypothetical protein